MTKTKKKTDAKYWALVVLLNVAVLLICGLVIMLLWNHFLAGKDVFWFVFDGITYWGGVGLTLFIMLLYACFFY